MTAIGDHAWRPTHPIGQPATGIIILHTITRDGDDPYTVETFSDAARSGRNHAAAYVADRMHDLYLRAPDDTVHTMTVVNRTRGQADDVWLTAGPVRGTRKADAPE